MCFLQYRERRDDPEPPRVTVEGSQVTAHDLYEVVRGQNFTTPDGVKAITVALETITKVE